MALSTSLVRAQQPPNDNFAAAAVISTPHGWVMASTEGATAEAGEPVHAGEPGGASLWWRWTAPVDGQIAFQLLVSPWSTALAIYTGDEVDNLTPVAGAVYRSHLGGFTDRITFDAVSGTTYRIAVVGLIVIPGTLQSTGNVSLDFGPPSPNDDFAFASTVSGFSGSVTGSNLYDSREPGEVVHAGFAGGASVWWQWTAPATGVVFFDTFGSNFDTVLAVYTGDRHDALTLVAQNDDVGNRLQSMVSFVAEAGTTYRVAVDGSELPDFDPPDPFFPIRVKKKLVARGDILLTRTWWVTIPSEPLRIESPGLLPGGSFRFFLHGPAGATGVIQRGDGLNAWEDWRPFTLDGSAMEIIDPDASTASSRFYRACAR